MEMRFKCTALCWSGCKLSWASETWGRPHCDAQYHACVLDMLISASGILCVHCLRWLLARNRSHRVTSKVAVMNNSSDLKAFDFFVHTLPGRPAGAEGRQCKDAGSAHAVIWGSRLLLHVALPEARSSSLCSAERQSVRSRSGLGRKWLPSINRGSGTSLLLQPLEGSEPSQTAVSSSQVKAGSFLV